MKYSDVVSQLKNTVPEFVTRNKVWNEDLPHDTFGSFALFLCEQIHQGASADLLDRAFGYINQMATSKDQNVVNLLIVSVLEVILDDEQCRIVALDYSSDETRALVDEMI